DALAVDSQRVYALRAGDIYTIPPATGQLLSPPNPSGVGGARFLIRDGTNLYYGGPNGELSRLATDGSGATELAPAATAAVVAGDRLYYVHGGTISAVCK
ncbi:MAG TPA: hypothetical protein VIA18_21790, partial [Polyangia bacterium]|nr:hypothetical protein [Polyangia bacterium]